MTTVTVQVNNFMKSNENPNIDILSKTFIVIQWLLGLNRIGIFCKTNTLKVLTTLYALTVISGLIFVAIFSEYIPEKFFAEIVKLIQFVICSILCYASRNKIRKYYDELNKFDTEIESKPGVDRASIIIFSSMVTICIISTFVLMLSPGVQQYIPLHLIHTIENHYYGLLFNLLNLRLQKINSSIQLSLICNPKFAGSSAKLIPLILKTDDKKSELAMYKLMDFYYIIITAYDLLTDAIKWQLLFIITTSFLYALLVSYNFASTLLSGEQTSVRIVVSGLVLMASDAIPLLAPCICCDKLRLEVRRLRELLASKLFESKLDKSNRSVARALLALTRARDLSFSLLRMVDISISLPFSFMGLLATYLIILLQFQKVINPYDRSSLTSPINKTSIVNSSN